MNDKLTEQAIADADVLAEIHERIMIEIAEERFRQDKKWGGPEHDDRHTIHDFAFFIRNYLGWAEQMASMDSPDKARNRMVQVAALAVAYLESHDRGAQ